MGISLENVLQLINLQKGDSSMQCTGASLYVSLNLTSVKYLQERNSCGEVSHKLDLSFYLKIDHQEKDSIRISNRIKKDDLIFTSLNTFLFKYIYIFFKEDLSYI